MNSSFTVTQSSNGIPSEVQIGVLHPAEAFDEAELPARHPPPRHRG